MFIGKPCYWATRWVLCAVLLLSLLPFPLCFGAGASGLSLCVKIDDQEYCLRTFAAADLEGLGGQQVLYSSARPDGNRVYIAASGVSLSKILESADLDPSAVQTLRYRTGDGGGRSLGGGDLFREDRYCFATSATGEVADPAETPETRKSAVPPMIALACRETHSVEDLDWNALDSADGYRLCFGQTTATESVDHIYGRRLTQLTVTLKPGTALEELRAKFVSVGEEESPPVDAEKPSAEDPAQAEKPGLPAGQLVIKVGYYGGSYVEKKTYSMAEMNALASRRQAYTWIDRMPAVVMNSVRGVRLGDLLEDAGIDLNSVENFYFYCRDVTDSWYQTMPKTTLIDTARYFYPNLPKCWDMELQTSTLGAMAQAVPVDAMIAVEDNWQRFGKTPDFDRMNTGSRFRLVFGQTDTNTPNAFRSARWVHCIEVMLGGTPPTGLTLDRAVLKLKAGSRERLTVHVTGDEHVDKRVAWISDNPSAATVDQEGNVRVLTGEPVLIRVTAMNGGQSAVCRVNPTQEVAADKTAAGRADEKKKEGGQGRKVLLAPKGSAQAGLQAWRLHAMAVDATELPTVPPDRSMLPAMATFSLLCYLGGGVLTYYQNGRLRA